MGDDDSGPVDAKDDVDLECEQPRVDNNAAGLRAHLLATQLLLRENKRTLITEKMKKVDEPLPKGRGDRLLAFDAISSASSTLPQP